jgi:hypothetical protein
VSPEALECRIRNRFVVVPESARRAADPIRGEDGPSVRQTGSVPRPISQMCLLPRYSPPIHLSHRFFYRHESTTSHVERLETGPGANPPAIMRHPPPPCTPCRTCTTEAEATARHATRARLFIAVPLQNLLRGRAQDKCDEFPGLSGLAASTHHRYRLIDRLMEIFRDLDFSAALIIDQG